MEFTTEDRDDSTNTTDTKSAASTNDQRESKSSFSFSKISFPSPEKMKEKEKKRSKNEKLHLSFRLYFHFLRSAFVMMVFVALIGLQPLCMNYSFNCKEFKNTYGDRDCPISL